MSRIIGLMTVGLFMCSIAMAAAAAPEAKGGTTEARAVLTELGTMLKSIPDSKANCEKLLNDIKVWQERKLKELDVKEPAASAPSARASSGPATGQITVAITKPVDDARLPEISGLEGTVSNPKATVAVVVFPVGTGQYWVQAETQVDSQTGRWRGSMYCGRPGDIDKGKPYEIRAFANPSERLTEGTKLSGWPEAEGASATVHATRE